MVVFIKKETKRNEIILLQKRVFKFEFVEVYLFDEIVRDALAYGIVRIGVKEIDELNIYEASRRGMRMLVESLALNHPDFVVTDCMPLPGLTLPYLHPASKGFEYQFHSL